MQKKIYPTMEDAKKDIFNYIEVFNNRKRRHASLGYVSPVVYEEMYEMKQERAHNWQVKCPSSVEHLRHFNCLEVH